MSMNPLKRHVAAVALSASVAALASVSAGSAAGPQPIGFSESPGDAYLECSNRDILIDRNHVSGQYKDSRDLWSFFVGGWARSSLEGEAFDAVAKVRRNGETQTIVSSRPTVEGPNRAPIQSDYWIGKHTVIPTGQGLRLHETEFHFISDGGARSQTVTLEDGWLYNNLDRGESRMIAIPYPGRDETRFGGIVESARAKGRNPKVKIQERVRCAGRGQWDTVHDFRLPGRRYNRTFDNPKGQSRVYRAVTKYAKKDGQRAKHLTVSPPTAVGFD